MYRQTSDTYVHLFDASVREADAVLENAQMFGGYVFSAAIPSEQFICFTGQGNGNGITETDTIAIFYWLGERGY